MVVDLIVVEKKKNGEKPNDAKNKLAVLQEGVIFRVITPDVIVYSTLNELRVFGKR